MTSSSFRQYPQPDLPSNEQIQAEWDSMRQVDLIDAQTEEEKKKKAAEAKKNESKLKAEQEKNKEKLQDPGPVGGALKEIGTAVVGAGIDAVEGVAGNAQQLLTGQINNPDFKPTWMQVDDRLEPLNKTWWGNLIRGVGEFGLLSAGVRGAANKAGGPAAQLLGGSGVRAELARGALIGNLSSQSQGENVSRMAMDASEGWRKGLKEQGLGPLVEAFEWLPEVLATNDADSPLMKRAKITLEGLGLDFVFDAVAGFLKGRRAAQQATEAQLVESQARIQTKIEQDAARQTRIQEAKQAYEGLRDQYNVAQAAALGKPKDDPAVAEAKRLRDQMREAGVRYRAEKSATNLETATPASPEPVRDNSDISARVSAAEVEAQVTGTPQAAAAPTRSSEPAGTASAPQSTTGLGELGNIGGGIGSSLRNQLWESWQKGSTRLAGIKDPVLVAAQRANVSRTDRAAFDQFLESYLAPVRDNEDIAARVSGAEIESNQKARQANFDELANSRLADDPEGLKGPDPYVNSPLYDPNERPIFSVKKDGLEKALLDAYRIDADPRYRDGRPETLFTEAALEKRLAGEDPVRRKVIESFAKKIGKSEEFIGEVNGIRVTRKEYQNLAVARALDTLDEFSDPEDLEAFKQKILSQPAVQAVGGRSVSYMNAENLAAAELLLNVTAGEYADIASAARSIRGVVDTTAQEDMVLRRMEFLLKETKKAKFIWGQTGNQMKVGGVNLISKSNLDEVTKAIDSEVSNTIQTLKDLRDKGDDALIQHFIDAASISGGKIQTLIDLDRYMKDRIWKWSGSPSEQGGIARGFVSTFVNSVLSGPKTFLRAWTGTSLAVALRPLTLYTGALMRGDARLQAKALHQMAVWHEGAGESIQLAFSAIKSHLAGEGIPYSGFAGNTDALHNTDQWKALGEWVQARGTDGDKAGYRIATMMSKFNNFPIFNYSMGLMGAGDAANRTILGRMELKSMAFDKAWDATKGTVDPQLVRKYEEEMRNLVFDKDGLVTDKAATMAGDEAALTTNLSGNFQKLEDLMNSQPLLKPFFMFPKTGINALKYAFSFNPLGTTMAKVPVLNTFLQEVDEVLNVTPDTLDAVMSKYGIKDIEAAKAMYEGRIAVGQMITFSAAGLYLSGGLTGNGPHDKETRNAWLQAGWKPRSIKIGGNWIGYDSIDPFASLLAMVADIGDNSDQLGQTFTETWYERLSYVIAMNLTNKSFLAGIQPLADILSAGGPGQQMARVGSMFINNAIPFSSLRKEIAEAMNPGMRELEDNLWDYIRNRNPGFKGQLPYKRDVLNGQPLRLYEPMVRFANIISPFQINPDWTETRELLRKSGFDIALTLRTDSKGNKLSPEQRSQLQSEMGKEGIEQKLAELFKTEQYLKSYQLAREVRNRGIPSNQWPIEAFYHTQAIKRIFDDAKAVAETRIRLTNGETQAVMQSQALGAAKEAAKAGDVDLSREYANLLQMYK